MTTHRLKAYLKENKVDYDLVTHPEEYTAQEIAHAEHISGKNVAKAVILRAEGRDVMVVIPADRMVDLLKVATALWTEDIRVQGEEEFVDLFPDCQAGAIPPFGKLYYLPTFVDRSLFEGEEIWFSAGNHHESLRMSTYDFRRIVDAEIGDFATPAGVRI